MCLVVSKTKINAMPYFPTFKAESCDIASADQKVMNEDVSRLDAYGQRYRFYAGDNQTNLVQLGFGCDGVAINPDLVSGMGSLGCTVIGMFASADGESSDNMAAFTKFSYKIMAANP